jgi:hypothetical protein
MRSGSMKYATGTTFSCADRRFAASPDGLVPSSTAARFCPQQPSLLVLAMPYLIHRIRARVASRRLGRVSTRFVRSRGPWSVVRIPFNNASQRITSP